MKASRTRLLILDAYNVIHRIPELRLLLARSLAQGREGLLRMCGDWMRHRNDFTRTIVVFDGDSSVVGGQGTGVSGVEAIYTGSSETADDRILSIVGSKAKGSECVVVSNDAYVMRHACALGSEAMSVDDFHATFRQSRERVRVRAEGGKADLTPGQAQAINEELKRVWGIE